MYDEAMGAGALGILGDLGLPEDLIEQVRSMLGGSARDLESGNVKPIAPAIFGGSEAGGVLGYNADLARQHVAKAVLQMAAGLRGYRTNLADFVDDVSEKDAQSATALKGIEASTVCVAAPNFETNNACTLPTPEPAAVGGE